LDGDKGQQEHGQFLSMWEYIEHSVAAEHDNFLLQAQRELKGLRAQHERLSEALSARNEELSSLRARLDAAAPSRRQGEDEDEAWLVQGTAWDR